MQAILTNVNGTIYGVRVDSRSVLKPHLMPVGRRCKKCHAVLARDNRGDECSCHSEPRAR
jgi:hypothetical protein